MADTHTPSNDLPILTTAELIKSLENEVSHLGTLVDQAFKCVKDAKERQQELYAELDIIIDQQAESKAKWTYKSAAISNIPTPPSDNGDLTDSERAERAEQYIILIKERAAVHECANELSQRIWQRKEKEAEISNQQGIVFIIACDAYGKRCQLSAKVNELEIASRGV